MTLQQTLLVINAVLLVMCTLAILYVPSTRAEKTTCVTENFEQGAVVICKKEYLDE